MTQNKEGFFMGFMDKITNFIAPEEGNEEYEEVTVAETPAAKPAQTANRYEQPQKTTGANALDANTKMVLFEPRSFGEAETIGQRLKEGRAVVVNLHKLDTQYAQRTIDFLTGVIFALNGSIQKIGTNVILCSPADIGVSGTITMAPDEPEEEEIAE